MPTPSRADRTLAVAAAAAHDLNDDLTIILTAVTSIMRTAGPDAARPMLLELRSAAQRCAWTASTLLNFTARRGVRPSAATVERLAAEDRLTG